MRAGRLSFHDERAWSTPTLPLVFLAGFLFEGFFVFQEKRVAATVLNGLTLAAVAWWAAFGLSRRRLPGGSTSMLLGNVLLGFGSVQGFAGIWWGGSSASSIVLKTVGTILILFSLDRLERRRVLSILQNTEEYLESIFESIPDPVFVIGPMRRIMAGNRAAIAMFGQHMIGKTCCEAYLNHRDCTSCTVTEVWNRRKPRHEIVRDERGARKFEVTTFPLMNRGGFSGRLFQQIRDVSSQVRAEDEASLLVDVVNSVGDPVITLGLNGAMLHKNRAADQLIVVDPVGAAPRSSCDLFAFVHESDRAAFIQAVRNWMPWEHEVRLFSHSSEERSIVLSIAPVRAADDRLLGTVIVARDVTEVKRLQVQLVQTEKLGALGELVSGVAHELNNPLTAVIGFGQLLLEADLDAERKEQVGYIHAHAIRCKRIIENLLKFARRHRTEKTENDLNEVVRSAVELLEYQLRLANVEIEMRLAKELPPTLMDPFQIQQVLINLLSNSQHAIEERGSPGRIEICTGLLSTSSLWLTFTDNGCGMTDEVLQRIFDPFFTTRGVGKGTGLGLSLSYGIVKDHGGQLTASSRKGLGTTFRLVLPLVRGKKARKSPLCVPVPADARHAGRVLVVDDEPVILELMRHLLGQSCEEVVTVADAERAFEQIERTEFDVVFTDWRMPRKSGQELYEALVADHPRYRGRVVFVTGDSLRTDVHEFAEKDGNHVVHKPFSAEQIHSVLGRIATQHGAAVQP